LPGRSGPIFTVFFYSVGRVGGSFITNLDQKYGEAGAFLFQNSAAYYLPGTEIPKKNIQAKKITGANR